MLAFVTLGHKASLTKEARQQGGNLVLWLPCDIFLGSRGFHLNERPARFVAKLQLLAGEPFNLVDEMSDADRGT